MTRFIMSLDEGVELVLFAFQHAESDDEAMEEASVMMVGHEKERI